MTNISESRSANQAIKPANLEGKLALLVTKACELTDGHLEIRRFTTSWKASLGTSYEGFPESLVRFHALPGFPTPEEAIDWLLEQIELEEQFPPKLCANEMPSGAWNCYGKQP